jgi:amidohydrolase
MPIINRIAEFHEDMKEWRQHLHSIPELTFDCHKTSAFVIERLREFGVDEIHEGIAKTGLVAIINGQGEGPTIGLRADMDALPITEIRDHAYKSQNPGKMHACGHDGHTTMLLGAARYLAETRNFKGRVALIFQPAEEGGGGGEVMCKEGIMNRFDIAQVYGVHNAPNIPLGNFLANSGPVMAAADSFEIRIAGRGGHGASPEETIDPVMVAVNIVQMLQTITSRNINALDNLVISVTQIHTGTIDNIIPSDAFINGTVRTLKKEIQALAADRIQAICDGVTAAFGATADVKYIYGYPPTVNHKAEADFATKVAQGVVGDDNVNPEFPPVMGAEDFSYMLEERPGAYLMIGQGDSAVLHHAEYDFNDELSPIGASYFVKLVETAQPFR